MAGMGTVRAREPAGPLTLLLATRPTWSDTDVSGVGLRVEDVPFVSVGGGLASFAVVDFLRVCGLPPAEIRVVSPQSRPHENLRHLMRRSQILDHDPLRSDSMSRVDNIWGFPSYAVSRAMTKRSVRPLWQVLTEPIGAEFFNPTPDEVFRGLDREAARIGWRSMLVPGRAPTIRRRDGGGYFVVVRPDGESEPFALRSRYVHLGTGYPALNYPREVSEYRLRHDDYFRVVNAYEPHEHVYEILMRRPGSVVVRGAGITASRVLERIIDDRGRSGQDVRIVHLFRTYADAAQGPWTFRRPAGEGWSYQPFSFPKAAGAGQLRHRLLRMDGEQRAEFIKSMGGTTSARRRKWQRQLRAARAGGYYRSLHGDVCDMAPADNGNAVRLRIEGDALPGQVSLEADFVLDCTGLKLALSDNPLMADLLEYGGASLNPLGGLDAGPHFEVRGAASDPGQVYASGVITRGGYLGPVDSFWGFSHTALLICDDLARRGLVGRLGLTRSVAGWLKWAAGRAP